MKALAAKAEKQNQFKSMKYNPPEWPHPRFKARPEQIQKFIQYDNLWSRRGSLLNSRNLIALSGSNSGGSKDRQRGVQVADTHVISLTGDLFSKFGIGGDFGYYLNTGSSPGEKFDFGYVFGVRFGAGIDASVGLEYTNIPGAAENINGTALNVNAGIAVISGTAAVLNYPDDIMDAVADGNYNKLNMQFSKNGAWSGAVEVSPLPASFSVTTSVSKKYGFRDIVDSVSNWMAGR